MESFIFASFRAIRSLVAPGMFMVFFFSVLATIGALFGFIIISSGFFTWMGSLWHDSALSVMIPVGGKIVATLIAWFLFPGIMPIIVNFFDERISTIIEQTDYPQAPLPITPAFWPEFWHNARFTIFIIFINIIVLPLYFIPLMNLFLFYGLNGYLLGREFFTAAARRHLSIAESESLRIRNNGVITFAGIMLTILATIPLLNLIAPFWGVAIMVHLYHQITPVNA